MLPDCCFVCTKCWFASTLKGWVKENACPKCHGQQFEFQSNNAYKLLFRTPRLMTYYGGPYRYKVGLAEEIIVMVDKEPEGYYKSFTADGDFLFEVIGDIALFCGDNQ